MNDKEKAFFFKNDQASLFGVLHTPDHQASSTSGSCGFVFCHPFAEEKLISHRIMVNVARALAADGYPVLRFDFFGHGDSDGHFVDSTVMTRLSDIDRAVEVLQNTTGVESIGLLGVRFGATLADIFSSDRSFVQRLVLISPILSGKTYMDQCLRSNLTTQMATYREVRKDREALVRDLEAHVPVNIDGYLLSGELYQQIASIDRMSDPPPKATDILIVQSARSEKEPVQKDLVCYQDRCRSSGIQTDIIKPVSSHFWKDSTKYVPRQPPLEDSILKWIKQKDSVLR